MHSVIGTWKNNNNNNNNDKNDDDNNNNSKSLLHLFANKIGDRNTFGVVDGGTLLLRDRDALLSRHLLADLNILRPAHCNNPTFHFLH